MYLLFDFDGTLVDSFNCVVEKTALLSEEFNFRKIKDHEIDSLRELSSKELIKFLKIPLYKMPILIYLMRKHLHNEMKNLAPVPNIYQVLEKLHHAGFLLGILTSNSVENVSMWLDWNNMSQFFDFIHIESSYFSKKYLLRWTLKTYKLDKSQTYYIGDETRDIDAAKKNDVKSIAVTWGYHSEKTLMKYHPSFIAQTPEDILTICGYHDKYSHLIA